MYPHVVRLQNPLIIDEFEYYYHIDYLYFGVSPEAVRLVFEAHKSLESMGSLGQALASLVRSEATRGKVLLLADRPSWIASSGHVKSLNGSVVEVDNKVYKHCILNLVPNYEAVSTRITFGHECGHYLMSVVSAYLESDEDLASLLNLSVNADPAPSRKQQLALWQALSEDQKNLLDRAKENNIDPLILEKIKKYHEEIPNRYFVSKLVELVQSEYKLTEDQSKLFVTNVPQYMSCKESLPIEIDKVKFESMLKIAGNLSRSEIFAFHLQFELEHPGLIEKLMPKTNQYFYQCIYSINSNPLNVFPLSRRVDINFTANRVHAVVSQKAQLSKKLFHLSTLSLSNIIHPKPVKTALPSKSKNSSSLGQKEPGIFTNTNGPTYFSTQHPSSLGNGQQVYLTKLIPGDKVKPVSYESLKSSAARAVYQVDSLLISRLPKSQLPYKELLKNANLSKWGSVYQYGYVYGTSEHAVKNIIKASTLIANSKSRFVCELHDNFEYHADLNNYIIFVVDDAEFIRIDNQPFHVTAMSCNDQITSNPQALIIGGDYKIEQLATLLLNHETYAVRKWHQTLADSTPDSQALATLHTDIDDLDSIRERQTTFRIVINHNCSKEHVQAVLRGNEVHINCEIDDSLRITKWSLSFCKVIQGKFIYDTTEIDSSGDKAAISMINRLTKRIHSFLQSQLDSKHPISHFELALTDACSIQATLRVLIMKEGGICFRLISPEEYASNIAYEKLSALNITQRNPQSFFDAFHGVMLELELQFPLHANRFTPTAWKNFISKLHAFTSLGLRELKTPLVIDGISYRYEYAKHLYFQSHQTALDAIPVIKSCYTQTSDVASRVYQKSLELSFDGKLKILINDDRLIQATNGDYGRGLQTSNFSCALPNGRPFIGDIIKIGWQTHPTAFGEYSFDELFIHENMHEFWSQVNGDDYAKPGRYIFQSKQLRNDYLKDIENLSSFRYVSDLTVPKNLISELPLEPSVRRGLFHNSHYHYDEIGTGKHLASWRWKYPVATNLPFFQIADFKSPNLKLTSDSHKFVVNRLLGVRNDFYMQTELGLSEMSKSSLQYKKFLVLALYNAEAELGAQWGAMRVLHPYATQRLFPLTDATLKNMMNIKPRLIPESGINTNSNKFRALFAGPSIAFSSKVPIDTNHPILSNSSPKFVPEPYSPTWLQNCKLDGPIHIDGKIRRISIEGQRLVSNVNGEWKFLRWESPIRVDIKNIPFWQSPRFWSGALSSGLFLGGYGLNLYMNYNTSKHWFAETTIRFLSDSAATAPLVICLPIAGPGIVLANSLYHPLENYFDYNKQQHLNWLNKAPSALKEHMVGELEDRIQEAGTARVITHLAKTCMMPLTYLGNKVADTIIDKVIPKKDMVPFKAYSNFVQALLNTPSPRPLLDIRFGEQAILCPGINGLVSANLNNSFAIPPDRSSNTEPTANRFNLPGFELKPQQRDPALSGLCNFEIIQSSFSLLNQDRSVENQIVDQNKESSPLPKNDVQVEIMASSDKYENIDLSSLSNPKTPKKFELECIKFGQTLDGGVGVNAGFNNGAVMSIGVKFTAFTDRNGKLSIDFAIPINIVIPLTPNLPDNTSKDGAKDPTSAEHILFYIALYVFKNYWDRKEARTGRHLNKHLKLTDEDWKKFELFLNDYPDILQSLYFDPKNFSEKMAQVKVDFDAFLNDLEHRGDYAYEHKNTGGHKHQILGNYYYHAQVRLAARQSWANFESQIELHQDYNNKLGEVKQKFVGKHIEDMLARAHALLKDKNGHLKPILTQDEYLELIALRDLIVETALQAGNIAEVIADNPFLFKDQWGRCYNLTPVIIDDNSIRPRSIDSSIHRRTEKSKEFHAEVLELKKLYDEFEKLVKNGANQADIKKAKDKFKSAYDILVKKLKNFDLASNVDGYSTLYDWYKSCLTLMLDNVQNLWGNIKNPSSKIDEVYIVSFGSRWNLPLITFVVEHQSKSTKEIVDLARDLIEKGKLSSEQAEGVRSLIMMKLCEYLRRGNFVQAEALLSTMLDLQPTTVDDKKSNDSKSSTKKNSGCADMQTQQWIAAPRWAHGNLGRQVRGRKKKLGSKKKKSGKSANKSKNEGETKKATTTEDISLVDQELSNAFCFCKENRDNRNINFWEKILTDSSSSESLKRLSSAMIADIILHFNKDEFVAYVNGNDIPEERAGVIKEKMLTLFADVLFSNGNAKALIDSLNFQKTEAPKSLEEIGEFKNKLAGRLDYYQALQAKPISTLIEDFQKLDTCDDEITKYLDINVLGRGIARLVRQSIMSMNTKALEEYLTGQISDPKLQPKTLRIIFGEVKYQVIFIVTQLLLTKGEDPKAAIQQILSKNVNDPELAKEINEFKEKIDQQVNYCVTNKNKGKPFFVELLEGADKIEDPELRVFNHNLGKGGIALLTIEAISNLSPQQLNEYYQQIIADKITHPKAFEIESPLIKKEAFQKLFKLAATNKTGAEQNFNLYKSGDEPLINSVIAPELDKWIQYYAIHTDENSDFWKDEIRKRRKATNTKDGEASTTNDTKVDDDILLQQAINTTDEMKLIQSLISELAPMTQEELTDYANKVASNINEDPFIRSCDQRAVIYAMECKVAELSYEDPNAALKLVKDIYSKDILNSDGTKSYFFSEAYSKALSQVIENIRDNKNNSKGLLGLLTEDKPQDYLTPDEQARFEKLSREIRVHANIQYARARSSKGFHGEAALHLEEANKKLSDEEKTRFKSVSWQKTEAFLHRSDVSNPTLGSVQQLLETQLEFFNESNVKHILKTGLRFNNLFSNYIPSPITFTIQGLYSTLIGDGATFLREIQKVPGNLFHQLQEKNLSGVLIRIQLLQHMYEGVDAMVPFLNKRIVGAVNERIAPAIKNTLDGLPGSSKFLPLVSKIDLSNLLKVGDIANTIYRVFSSPDSAYLGPNLGKIIKFVLDNLYRFNDKDQERLKNGNAIIDQKLFLKREALDLVVSNFFHFVQMTAITLANPAVGLFFSICKPIIDSVRFFKGSNKTTGLKVIHNAMCNIQVNSAKLDELAREISGLQEKINDIILLDKKDDPLVLKNKQDLLLSRGRESKRLVGANCAKIEHVLVKDFNGLTYNVMQQPPILNSARVLLLFHYVKKGYEEKNYNYVIAASEQDIYEKRVNKRTVTFHAVNKQFRIPAHLAWLVIHFRLAVFVTVKEYFLSFRHEYNSYIEYILNTAPQDWKDQTAKSVIEAFKDLVKQAYNNYINDAFKAKESDRLPLFNKILQESYAYYSWDNLIDNLTKFQLALLAYSSGCVSQGSSFLEKVDFGEIQADKLVPGFYGLLKDFGTRNASCQMFLGRLGTTLTAKQIETEIAYMIGAKKYDHVAPFIAALGKDFPQKFYAQAAAIFGADEDQFGPALQLLIKQTRKDLSYWNLFSLLIKLVSRSIVFSHGYEQIDSYLTSYSLLRIAVEAIKNISITEKLNLSDEANQQLSQDIKVANEKLLNYVKSNKKFSAIDQSQAVEQILLDIGKLISTQVGLSSLIERLLTNLSSIVASDASKRYLPIASSIDSDSLFLLFGSSKEVVIEQLIAHLRVQVWQAHNAQQPTFVGYMFNYLIVAEKRACSYEQKDFSANIGKIITLLERHKSAEIDLNSDARIALLNSISLMQKKNINLYIVDEDNNLKISLQQVHHASFPRTELLYKEFEKDPKTIINLYAKLIPLTTDAMCKQSVKVEKTKSSKSEQQMLDYLKKMKNTPNEAKLAEVDSKAEEIYQLAIWFISKAHELQEQGLVSEAVTLLRHALEISPGHAKAHYLLGLVFKERKDLSSLKQAQHHFEEALKFNPNLSTDFLSETLYELGKNYLELKTPDSKTAADYFIQAKKLGHYQSAVELLSINDGQEVRTISQWDELGRKYYFGTGKDKDLGFARVCFEKILQLNTNHKEANYMVGMILAISLHSSEQEKKRSKECLQLADKQGHEEAKKLLLQIENSSSTADQWFDLGENFKKANNNPGLDLFKARVCYEAAKKKSHYLSELRLLQLDNPTFGVADWYREATKYTQLQMYKLARKYYDVALEIEPNHPDSLYALGEDYERGLSCPKDLAQAKQYYTKPALANRSDAQYRSIFVDLQIENSTASGLKKDWTTKALDYWNEEGTRTDYLRARVCYDLAIVADQKAVNALFYLGHFYKQGYGVAINMAKAQYYFEQAAAENHYRAKDALLSINYPLNTADEWFQLGDSYYFGKDYKGRVQPVDYRNARACFHKALVLNPNHVDSLARLAGIYEFGTCVPANFITAKEYLEKLTRMNPSYGHWLLRVEIRIEEQTSGNRLENKEHWFQLAEKYSRGISRTINYKKACICYLEAVDDPQQGSQALYVLGWIYVNGGQGVVKDLVKGIIYYLRSSLQRNANATAALTNLNEVPFNSAKGWYDLGEDFYIGRNGREQNRALARLCYEQAVRYRSDCSEYGYSLYSLGIYFQGESKFTEAKKYHLMASKYHDDALRQFLILH